MREGPLVNSAKLTNIDKKVLILQVKQQHLFLSKNGHSNKNTASVKNEGDEEAGEEGIEDGEWEVLWHPVGSPNTNSPSSTLVPDT